MIGERARAGGDVKILEEKGEKFETQFVPCSSVDTETHPTISKVNGRNGRRDPPCLTAQLV